MDALNIAREPRKLRKLPCFVVGLLAIFGEFTTYLFLSISYL